MREEMVKVTLFEDGKYTVEDISSSYATQRMYGSVGGVNVETYYCPKRTWKRYLFKLVASINKDIDKEIKALQKRKAEVLKIKEQLMKEFSEKEV